MKNFFGSKIIEGQYYQIIPKITKGDIETVYVK